MCDFVSQCIAKEMRHHDTQRAAFLAQLQVAWPFGMCSAFERYCLRHADLEVMGDEARFLELVPAFMPVQNVGESRSPTLKANTAGSDFHK